MLRICGIGILVAVISFLLSELGFRGKRALGTLGVVLFLLVFIDLAKDAITKIADIPISEQGRKSFSSALKIIGVGHAFGISGDICTELSEGGVASMLLLIGRLEIVLIIIPYLRDLVEYSSKMLS